MDVLISENVTGDGVEVLRRDWDVVMDASLWSDQERLVAAVRETRALIVRNQTRVTSELLSQSERLEVVARAGAGLDNIDTRAATEAGIVVCYAPNENSVSAAELTIGLMLALARNVSRADSHVRDGGWNRQAYMGLELNGKMLGIVGFGRIGRLVAERARALGMRLVVHDPCLVAGSSELDRFAAQWLTLDELLRVSEIITIHVPLMRETMGMINQNCFDTMREGALFINASRGEVVDEPALIRALQSRRLAGAALDVRATEPPQLGQLELMENVLLTPHIGAFTYEAQNRVIDVVCQDVAAVLRGEAARQSFNFDRPR